ncbi:MAG: hypothetical protein LBU89_01690 [Fibromonadaceae bacterium]|jgi:hypothetical protein|nr:hypothetical protein [Fibromonadaceae bacterium]
MNKRSLKSRKFTGKLPTRSMGCEYEFAKALRSSPRMLFSLSLTREGSPN